MAPNKQRSQKATASAAPFDEAALSKLTAKIGKNLSTPSSKENGKRKRQPTENDDSRNSSKKRPKPQDQRYGKPGPQQESQNKSEELLTEIKALGGDEADLDLVAGIDSDAEEGQEKKPERPLDKDFHGQLAQFASGLGFEKVRDAAVEAPDSEGEEVDEEGEEDGQEKADEVPPAKSQAAQSQQKGRKSSKLAFEPRPDWHAVNQQHLPTPSADDIRNFSAVTAKLKSYASELLEADAMAYRETLTSSSSRKFMSTIMSSGTMSDRVSALTLEIQESPVHNVKAFDSLVGLAEKRSRGQAIAALAALVDLLGNGVALPNDRRLRTFSTQPGLLGTLQTQTKSFWKPGDKLPGKLTNQILIMWVFEDWLKDAYFKIIQLLEVWAGDEIEYSRSRSLDFIFGLLKEKPEQEANLLRLLVNKLGDRERKIASRASFLILQLLNIHPAMKAIVIRAIEQEVLLRPGQSQRAKYYAISTLNQTILSSKDPSVADTLVRIYFELFLTLLKSGALGEIDIPGSEKLGGGDEGKDKKSRKKARQQKEDDATTSERATAEKLVSAILTGINRAIPFAATDESTLESHFDTLFRITHSSNFNTSVQALVLIQQVAVSKHIAVGRYYRTLYESLLDARLITSSKQALYLNLLYRSLKNDIDVRRVKAFVKRMLQVVNLHQPSFMCGILYLVAELETTFPDLKSLLSEPEETDEDEEEVYKDVDGDPAKNENESPAVETRKSAYDGRKRNPEYSNAHRSCLWELMPYLEHFHPTVAAFASNLLVPQASLPKPDLTSHTLMHFLDKFVYRNPKANDSKRGSSIMQPILGSGSAAHIVTPGKAGAKQQPTVNSAAFWNKKVKDVAAEDIFFHEYFSQIGKPSQKGKKEKKEAAEDDSEAEEEIWQALVESRPDIEGEESDDVDMDIDMDDDDDDDLGSLLDMSDSDDEEDTDGNEGEEGEAPNDGDVEFVDFSDEGEAEGGASAKQEKSKGSKLRRKQLKALPTFASVDDYAEMLAGEVDEDYT